jgi:hypothetical protein
MSSKRQKVRSDVKKGSEIGRNEVMNDDVLSNILMKLNVKQLLQLERVSKQFSYCVNQVLKQQNGLRIGTKLDIHLCDYRKHSIKGGNITNAIILKDNEFYDLIQSKNTLKTILKKCVNIKCFYLTECCVDIETIELITTHCKRLECLCLVHIYCPLETKTWKEIGRLLSLKNLIHLSINSQCLPLRKQITRNIGKNRYDILYRFGRKQYLSTEIVVLVKQLSSLQNLIISDYRKPLIKLFNCLPQTIRSLYLSECHKLNTQSMLALINGNAKHLTDLKVDIYIYERDFESQIFNIICSNLKLKKFCFYCGELPITSISQIEKLQVLQQLKIDFAYNSFINFKNIEINSLKTLSSLHLENCGFKPRMLAKFAKQFPNIKQLTLKSVNFICGCNELEEDDIYDPFYEDYDFCETCYQKCVDFISLLPQLKSLHIHFDCNDIRLSLINSLERFKGLESLSLPWFPNEEPLLEQILISCKRIAENKVPNKLFTLKIDEDIIDQLTGNTFDICLPKNLRLIKSTLD